MLQQLKIIVLMLKYLALATFILAAAAAFYLWLTWPPAPGSHNIYIQKAPPQATVVLQMEDGNGER